MLSVSFAYTKSAPSYMLELGVNRACGRVSCAQTAQAISEYIKCSEQCRVICVTDNSIRFKYGPTHQS